MSAKNILFEIKNNKRFKTLKIPQLYGNIYELCFFRSLKFIPPPLKVESAAACVAPHCLPYILL